MRLALVLVVACGSPAAPTPPTTLSPSAPVTVDAPPIAPSPTTPSVAGECIGPTCFTSPAGFRFVHPLPVGETLRKVFVTPSGEVWIAGDHATLLHITRGPAGPVVGKVSIANVPTVASVFESIEKGSAKDFPGGELQPLDFDGLAVGASSIWVAAGSEHIIHWDGRAWTHFPTARAGEEMMIAKDGRMWVVGAINVFGNEQTP